MPEENRKKYVWRTEPNACERCQELDGMEFDSLDEVPEKPHPNCKCTVETVIEASCDCYAIIDEMEQLEAEAEMMNDEVSAIGDAVNDAVEEYFKFSLSMPARAVYAEISEFENTWKIFTDYKQQMADLGVKDMDKYYHARANCEATQNGLLGTIWAAVLSVAKELNDLYTKVVVKKMDFDFIVEDCLRDLRADLYGISKGRDSGSCTTKVKDAPIFFPEP